MGSRLRFLKEEHRIYFIYNPYHTLLGAVIGGDASVPTVHECPEIWCFGRICTHLYFKRDQWSIATHFNLHNLKLFLKTVYY